MSASDQIQAYGALPTNSKGDGFRCSVSVSNSKSLRASLICHPPFLPQCQQASSMPLSSKASVSIFEAAQDCFNVLPGKCNLPSYCSGRRFFVTKSGYAGAGVPTIRADD